MNENKDIQQEAEKMFTQSDVNRIIGERLSRDKSKENEAFEKRESDLTARELRFSARQLLAEKGLPTELADILKLDDEKSVTEAVELLSQFIGKKEQSFPKIKERRLPESTNTEDNGKLRRAFGLV